MQKGASEHDLLGLAGYLAPEGYVDTLREELCGVGAEVAFELGRLLFAARQTEDPAWAQNVWRDPRLIPIRSIRDGARKLRAIQRNWSLYSARHHRRAALIRDALPPVSAKPLEFGAPPPRAPLGSFTLYDEHAIIASPRCSSPFKNGEVRFVEDKRGPPSRAYLKLWEALTLVGIRPGPNDVCVDLGASPGGFTWVLSELGASVIAVDRAPLDPAIAARHNVRQELGDAFSLDPRRLGAIDWLVADIAAYPRRLLELLSRWDRAGALRRAICTIKFQGKTDHAAARAFTERLGGTLRHLSHNRHELTWMRIPADPPPRDPTPGDTH